MTVGTDRKSQRRRLLGARASLLGASIAGVLAAATAPAASGATPAPSEATQRGATYEIDEVLVTAQRREENLQTVPIAITAVDAQALQDARAEI